MSGSTSIWRRLSCPACNFSHERDVFERDGTLFPTSEYNELLPGETVESLTVRFRTIGDTTCTGAVESSAKTVGDIINEVAASRITERGGRADDKRSEAAMEDRKKQGYF